MINHTHNQYTVEIPYYYMLLRRLCGIGTQPDGFRFVEERNKAKDGCHAIIAYNRELTDQECKQYELKQTLYP